jgi:hypothetical protein
VWRESQRIVNSSGITQTGVTVVFRQEFGEIVISGTETMATPTDYFRYEVAVIDTNHPMTNPLYTFSGDYASLMENQWIARLPKVQEESAGAAPDELIVTYCDMFPFQKSVNDPSTWLPRKQVTDYVGTQLLPLMVEAFRVQTDEWGFPWYQAWTSYRSGEDAERMSVALSDGQTWFHGSAPDSGHSGISIRVKGTSKPYDTLTDGLMSIFHHELFHSLQRNINLNNGGNGDVSGEKDVWGFFSEGMAVLASSVGQPVVQFVQTSGERTYMSFAHSFVGGGVGDLNRSYETMIPYHAAVYWRFLYEQCGGMKDDVEDPAAGMEVIRRTLRILYSGDVVDISSSVDLVGAVPEIMDRALDGSSCPFKTHEESLTAFARTIYALGLDGGRCSEPGNPDGCGFYDPHDLYHDPPVSTITYTGKTIAYAEADQPFPAGVRSSFGMDFVDVVFGPDTEGRPLTLEFYGAPGAEAEFSVQLWKLIDSGGDTGPQRVPTQMTVPEVLTKVNAAGSLFYVIPEINTAEYNRLGLIVTRLDAKESSDPVGEYTIALRPGTDND